MYLTEYSVKWLLTCDLDKEWAKYKLMTSRKRLRHGEVRRMLEITYTSL